jgi:hypothetical protein
LLAEPEADIGSAPLSRVPKQRVPKQRVPKQRVPKQRVPRQREGLRHETQPRRKEHYRETKSVPEERYVPRPKDVAAASRDCELEEERSGARSPSPPPPQDYQGPAATAKWEANRDKRHATDWRDQLPAASVPRVQWIAVQTGVANPKHEVEAKLAKEKSDARYATLKQQADAHHSKQDAVHAALTQQAAKYAAAFQAQAVAHAIALSGSKKPKSKRGGVKRKQAAIQQAERKQAEPKPYKVSEQ